MHPVPKHDKLELEQEHKLGLEQEHKLELEHRLVPWDPHGCSPSNARRDPRNRHAT